MIFKHYCGIKRDIEKGTNGRTEKVTISVANKCLILPMANRVEIDNDFSVGSGYDVYFLKADQDVEPGDQIIWNTKVFNVRAVRPYDVPGVGHTHCLVTKDSVK